MKPHLAWLLLELPISAWAGQEVTGKPDEPVEALVCFNTREIADRVVSAREIEPDDLRHTQLIEAGTLSVADPTPLTPPLSAESPKSYLSRVVSRLRVTAPRLARRIQGAYAELKGRVQFEKSGLGPVQELESSDSSPAGRIDPKLCVLAPVLSPLAAGQAPEQGSEVSPLLGLDIRLFWHSQMSAQSQAAILLQAYLNRFVEPRPGAPESATIAHLLLASNPTATYFTYLNELGAARLLPELPSDGKIWAAPGYELLGAVIEKLIRHAGPFLDDEAVSGGLALRSEVETFARPFEPDFSCPQAPLPPGDEADNPERTEFSRFRACNDALVKLLSTKSPEARAAGLRWSTALLSFLDQKAGNARLGTSEYYSEEPPVASGASPGAPKKKSLRERLDTYPEFTENDHAAIETGITALIQQIGDSVSQDGSDRPAGEASEPPVVELADPFAILRQVRLHYFDATVPQISPEEPAPAQVIDLWSGTGASLQKPGYLIAAP